MWVDVCAFVDLVPDRGAAALVGGLQVAVFLVDGEVFALSNFDPFSKAFVLSRGIVRTTRGDRLKVASPIYKQSFDLRTGQMSRRRRRVRARVRARVVEGRVQVGAPR